MLWYFSCLNSDLQATSGEPTNIAYTNALNNFKNIWDSLAVTNSGTASVATGADNVGGAQVIVHYYKHISGNYGTGLFTSYGLQRPMFATLTGGVWKEPVLL